MIARYTRPEIGALWTDEARMEAWRRVEVAACEAMEGPSGAELDAIRVVRGMVVHEQRMRENLDITCGALFSQRVLLALVEGGMQRDEAYRIAGSRAARLGRTDRAA